MKFLSNQVADDLRAGRSLRLELGSGGHVREGYYGVDMLPLPGVAIQADLNQRLDLLPAGSVSEVLSQQCFEHVTNLLGLMSELHRVMTPGAKLDITVPHFSNPYFYSDPTHIRFFGLYSMFYFVPEEFQTARRKVPSFYSEAMFRVQNVQMSLLPRSLACRLRWPFLSRLINRNIEWADWYERRLCWQVPAANIRYVMTPVK